MWRLLSIVSLLATCSLHAAEVRASLSSENVEAGKGVLLSIEVQQGSPHGQPQIPQVANLIIDPRGKTNQVQMVNGHVSRSTQFNYVVGSNQPGNYTIPSITVRVNDRTLRTTPLKLTVQPNRSGAPAGMQEEPQQTNDSDYGYLSFQMIEKDRQYVYPGEIAPIRIRAYFPIDARVTLNGIPRPEGSAFVLHNLSDQPKQQRTVIQEKRYLMLTWYGGLSATKAGTYPANISLDASVSIRDPSALSTPSPFGSSLLDDFFAPMIQKDISLSIENPPDIEVRELPQEGRPEDFTGAIGKFQFVSQSIPRNMQTGEPTPIKALIAGEGDFTLLKRPHPKPAEEWKTYDGHEQFTPKDAASFSGEKSFDFNIVPLQPGSSSFRLGLSYFDPEAGEYRHIESTPQEVTITGDPAAASFDTDDSTPAPSPPAPQLAPIRTTLGAVASYEPWSLAPGISICALLTAALGIGSIWNTRRNDPSRLARQAAQHACTQAMREAAQAIETNNAPAFFQAAKKALSEQFAQREPIHPEAVTLADLQGHVDAPVLDLWRTADQWQYSGNTATATELKNFLTTLQQGMQSLTSNAS